MSYHGDHSDSHFDFSYIHDLEISESLSGRIITSHELRMNSMGNQGVNVTAGYYTMRFVCHKTEFEIKLKPNPNVIHPETKITVVGAAGSRTKSFKEHINAAVYQGHLISKKLFDLDHADADVGVASILFHTKRYFFKTHKRKCFMMGDDILSGKISSKPTAFFEGSFSTKDGTTFEISTKDSFHSIRRNQSLPFIHWDKRRSVKVKNQIVARRSSDYERFAKRDKISASSDGIYRCGFKDDFFTTLPLESFSPKQLTTFNQFPKREDGCPSEKVMLYMGVAADCTYTEKRKGVDSSIRQILNVWNQLNSLYSRSFNIPIGVNEILVYETCDTKDGKIPWNRECSDDYIMDDRLSGKTSRCLSMNICKQAFILDFSKWRGNKKDNSGLWHLVS